MQNNSILLNNSMEFRDGMNFSIPTIRNNAPIFTDLKIRNEWSKKLQMPWNQLHCVLHVTAPNTTNAHLVWSAAIYKRHDTHTKSHFPFQWNCIYEIDARLKVFLCFFRAHFISFLHSLSQLIHAHTLESGKKTKSNQLQWHQTYICIVSVFALRFNFCTFNIGILLRQGARKFPCTREKNFWLS